MAHGHLRALTQSHTWSHAFCTTPMHLDTVMQKLSHTVLDTAMAAQIPPGLTRSSLELMSHCQSHTHTHTTRMESSQASQSHQPSGHSHPLSHTDSPSRTNTSPSHTPTHSQLDKHLHGHTGKLPSVTPRATQRHVYPAPPPAPHTRPHQSLTRESRPLPHSGGADEKWGASEARTSAMIGK